MSPDDANFYILGKLENPSSNLVPTAPFTWTFDTSILGAGVAPSAGRMTTSNGTFNGSTTYIRVSTTLPANMGAVAAGSVLAGINALSTKTVVPRGCGGSTLASNQNTVYGTGWSFVGGAVTSGAGYVEIAVGSASGTAWTPTSGQFLALVSGSVTNGTIHFWKLAKTPQPAANGFAEIARAAGMSGITTGSTFADIYNAAQAGGATNGQFWTSWTGAPF
jgi:hypothetical protein